MPFEDGSDTFVLGRYIPTSSKVQSVFHQSTNYHTKRKGKLRWILHSIELNYAFISRTSCFLSRNIFISPVWMHVINRKE